MGKTIILIDNFDSFTFNIAQMIGAINKQFPIVIPNSVHWRELCKIPHDRIIISPGPGTPHIAADVGCSMDAITHAKVPILGVCLGHQCIALHNGAQVNRGQTPLHGRIRETVHDGDPLFQGIPTRFDVVRYHSLIVAPDLPQSLKAIAWDKDKNVMALRHKTRPHWGVQFHPESICSEYGEEIFANFLFRLDDGAQSSAAHLSEEAFV